MSKIFISYRRDDSSGYAHAIHNQLVQHFSKDQVFMDVDTLEPGMDFVRAIEKAVGECDVLVAIIGKRWVGGESGGTSRLENTKDYVRLEVSTALERNIRVIPVLVDGMTMPNEDSLPLPVRPITRRNAIEISHTRLDYDVERLIVAVRRALGEAVDKPQADKQNRRHLNQDDRSVWRAYGPLAAAVVLVIFTAVVWWSKRQETERVKTLPDISDPPASTSIVTADIYSHQLGFTQKDAETLQRVLENNGIPSRILIHRDPNPPDAIFIGALVGAKEARITISSIPYDIKYIFTPDYPAAEGGDPSGFLIGIGYMSSHFKESRGRSSEPVKVSAQDLQHITEPELTNTEFQHRLRVITKMGSALESQSRGLPLRGN